MKAPTIKDVARMAGVSVATVSRVVNGYKWVSPEVCKRVNEAIKELDYKPNYSAWVTATGKSRMVVILVPDVVSPYFAQYISLVSQRMMEAGYATMFFQTQNNVEIELGFFDSGFVQAADGIISVTDGLEDEHIRAILPILRRKDRPVLFVDRYLPDELGDYITNDNIGGIRTIVEYLHKKGHVRIAMILGKLGSSVVKDKVKGFYAAAQEFGIPLRDDYIRFHDWTVEGGREETEFLMNLESPPTAIIACNNFICEGAAAALKDMGLVIGQDISLVGVEECASDKRLFTNMGITTIKLDSIAMAEYSAEYMLSRLGRDKPQDDFESMAIKMELYERNSVVDLMSYIRNMS